MRTGIRIVALLVMIVGMGAGSARAACTDPAALVAARAAVDVACPCAAAVSPGAYRRCVRPVATALVVSGALPSSCLADLRRCTRRSTCGRSGTVPCCRASTRGSMCQIRPSAARCRAAGGVPGTGTSCCDACSASTTTTTSTVPTTTTPAGPPCLTSGYPTCGGSCGGGTVCAPVLSLNDNFAFCRCVNPNATCTAGACGEPGVCAPGLQCAAGLLGDQVFCQGCVGITTTTTTTALPTTTTTLVFDGTCGTAPFPTCGGACAPGFVCQGGGFRTGTGIQGAACTCVSETSSCQSQAQCVPARCPNPGEACVYDLTVVLPGCRCEVP